MPKRKISRRKRLRRKSLPLKSADEKGSVIFSKLAGDAEIEAGQYGLIDKIIDGYDL